VTFLKHSVYSIRWNLVVPHCMSRVRSLHSKSSLSNRLTLILPSVAVLVSQNVKIKVTPSSVKICFGLYLIA